MLEVERSLLLMSIGGYSALTLLGYALWRFVRRQAVTLFGALLIIDGVFLAWIAQATGGSASPLRYLILLHLVVVALLASYRTGLKLAMWHSLLLWVGYQAQKSGVMRLSEAAARPRRLRARAPDRLRRHGLDRDDLHRQLLVGQRARAAPPPLRLRGAGRDGRGAWSTRTSRSR